MFELLDARGLQKHTVGASRRLSSDNNRLAVVLGGVVNICRIWPTLISGAGTFRKMALSNNYVFHHTIYNSCPQAPNVKNTAEAEQNNNKRNSQNLQKNTTNHNNGLVPAASPEDLPDAGRYPQPAAALLFGSQPSCDHCTSLFARHCLCSQQPNLVDYAAGDSCRRMPLLYPFLFQPEPFAANRYGLSEHRMAVDLQDGEKLYVSVL